jgi:hypothetical protein
MNIIQAIVLNLAVGALLANLPFLRLVGVRRWHPAANDLLGWIAGYALWMGGAAVLEAAAGKLSDKNWEVWALTLALFAVLAFPGLVWRHLLQK